MNLTHDVIVVGAGVVGLSAAIAMRQRQLSVALVDAKLIENSAQSSRVYALNAASQELLEQLGVWEKLDSLRVSRYSKMHVWDGQNNAHINFDARMMAADKLGAIIEESNIKHALLQKAVELDVVFLPNTQVTGIDIQADSIYIQGNDCDWSAQLMIVADGAQSSIRSLLGVTLTTWPYHQHALVATVETSLPHQSVAFQVFNADGPLAFLPLSDPNHCSIVWSTTAKHAQLLMEMDEDAFNINLTKAFAEKLGACRLLGPRHQFPLRMRHTHQYHGEHWILMGDAAHTIHPLAGLGLNVGLADVASWLEIIDKNSGVFCSSRNLRAYQRHRKNAVWKVIALMEALKALFANPLPIVKRLRAQGLGLCEALPLLKRFFVEQAAGRNF